MEKIKVTTFKEYQEAAWLTCTQPQCKTMTYMALGLVGEAGEVANKVKKISRDDYGKLTAERSKAILGELGDVMWYIAGMCTLSSFTPGIFTEFKDFASLQRWVDEENGELVTCDYSLVALELCYHSNVVAKDSCSSFYGRTSRVIKDVAALGKMIGYNLQQICQHNIDVLADRYNRNKIEGDGDER